MATSILPDQARQYRTKIAMQPEPPKCPYNNIFPDRRHPDGLNARACPTCRARNRWVAARRRERIADGTHILNDPGNRGNKANPELRKPVPKCGLYHPSYTERRDCPRCKSRKKYVLALLRDARSEGRDIVVMADAARVARYVTDVLMPSGLNARQIAARAGVTELVIGKAVRGVTKKMLTVNADAILAVEPQPYPKIGKGTTVDGTGTRRKLRGLCAQGWTTNYMAGLEGMAWRTMWKWIDGRHRFVSQATVDSVQRLVDKLGSSDIAELDKPMDGMSWLSAQRAAKRGWVVLADWDGLDIDDPRVTPHGADEALEASNGLVLVDPGKVTLALDFLPVEAADGTLTADRFTLPLTKMEMYETIRAGSERDHAGEPRFSANLLAQRLGTTERTVQRARAELARADRILDAAPPQAATAIAAGLILATAEWPATLRLQAAGDLLALYPIRRGFYRDLVVLAATQPAPYGRGWSDTQLAVWLGCTEQHAVALRGRAVLAARHYQAFPADGETGRPRNLGMEPPRIAA